MMMNDKITLMHNKGSQAYAWNDTRQFKEWKKKQNIIFIWRKKKTTKISVVTLYMFCSLKPPQQWKVKKLKNISAQNTRNFETTWNNIIHVINFKPSYTTILISFHIKKNVYKLRYLSFRL